MSLPKPSCIVGAGGNMKTKKLLAMTLALTVVAFPGLRANAEELEQPTIQISDDKSVVYAEFNNGISKSTTEIPIIEGLGTQIQLLETTSFSGYVEIVPFGQNGDFVAALVNDNSVSLTWSNDVAEVSVEDVSEARTLSDAEDNFTSDLDVHPGAVETYTLEGSRVADAQSNAIAVDFLNLPLAIPSTAAQVSVLKAVNQVQALALASTSTFRQNSFIPDAYLGAPPAICTNVWDTRPFRFVGDNRSWSTADNVSSRTHMDLKVTWGTSTPGVTLIKDVGETVRQVQNANGVWSFESRLTATDASMTATIVSRTSSMVSLRLAQNVVNPMCDTKLTNGIFANTTVSIYRSGVVSGTITYLQMPNYELYFRQDAAPWRSLALLPYLGVWCLATVGGATCVTSTTFP